jgi:hypothetical protein
MASDLAIVSGLTGRIASVSALKAVLTGEQPVACAPKILVGLVLDQTERDQFLERLVHLGQLGAGGDRNDDLVGQPPPELFGDLIAQRLGALGVEGAHVDVDERPALLLTRDLRGEFVDVVVVAVDRHQLLGVDRAVDLLGVFEVAGDEDDRTNPGARTSRSDGVGQVAGARAGEDLGVELASRTQGTGDDAVLEGVGRVGGVVLDPELWSGRVPWPGCRPGAAG